MILLTIFLIVAFNGCRDINQTDGVLKDVLNFQNSTNKTKIFVRMEENISEEWTFDYEGEEIKKIIISIENSFLEDSDEEEMKEMGLNGMFTTDPDKFFKAASTIPWKRKIKEFTKEMQKEIDRLAEAEEQAFKKKGVYYKVKYDIKKGKYNQFFEFNFSKVEKEFLDEIGFSFLNEIGMTEVEKLLWEGGFAEKGKKPLTKAVDNEVNKDNGEKETHYLNGEVDQEYIFPFSDAEYLTYKEIEFLVDSGGIELLRLAINEMFARHGFVFSKEENRSYFSEKSWYYPVTDLTDEYIKTNLFNEYESENLKKMIEIEEKYKR